MTKISVITASYNYEEYIKETIESVINQTFSDWEMIIVDDGSKDNSVEVIKSYCEKDERIKLLQHENGENKGLVETIRLGVKEAKGEWIVFLESDDTISPDYMAEKIKIAEENTNIKFIFNDVNLFGEESAIKEIYDEYFVEFYKTMPNLKTRQDYIDAFKTKNIVPTFSVVMMKKEIFETLKFDSVVSQWIDYYLWTQLAPKYDFYYLPQKLTNWRMHKSSYNNKKTSSYKGVVFLDVQIADNLSEGKYKLWHRIRASYLYMRAFKRKFVRFHPKDRELILLGKVYKY